MIYDRMLKGYSVYLDERLCNGHIPYAAASLQYSVLKPDFATHFHNIDMHDHVVAATTWHPDFPPHILLINTVTGLRILIKPHLPTVSFSPSGTQCTSHPWTACSAKQSRLEVIFSALCTHRRFSSHILHSRLRYPTASTALQKSVNCPQYQSEAFRISG
jgi:hypothetical protein